MIAIAIPIGLLIGLSLGALGGGGSILTVPVLVYLLHQQPHDATTGSLLIVGSTALAGVAAHRRAGRVRLAQGVTFGVLGVAGSYAGTKLSASVRPDLLLTLFAGLMLVAAAAMLARRRRPGQRSEDRGGPVEAADPGAGTGTSAGPARAAAQTMTLTRPLARPAPGRAIRERLTAAGYRRMATIVAAATVVGLLTGFFGVGGGFVIVPALVLALGFDMPAAVGTSLLVIAINSAAALAVRLGGQVYLDWALLGAFTAAALAGTLAGSRIASRVDAARLTTAFAILLVAVAAYSLGRSLPGLT